MSSISEKGHKNILKHQKHYFPKILIFKRDCEHVQSKKLKKKKLKI